MPWIMHAVSKVWLKGLRKQFSEMHFLHVDIAKRIKRKHWHSRCSEIVLLLFFLCLNRYSELLKNTSSWFWNLCISRISPEPLELQKKLFTSICILVWRAFWWKKKISNPVTKSVDICSQYPLSIIKFSFWPI